MPYKNPEDRRAYQRTYKRVTPRRLNAARSEHEKGLIVHAYLTGEKVAWIRQQFRIDHTTLMNLVRDAKVAIRPAHRSTTLDDTTILAERDRGEKLDYLAVKYGVHPSTILRAVKRARLIFEGARTGVSYECGTSNIVDAAQKRSDGGIRTESVDCIKREAA